MARKQTREVVAEVEVEQVDTGGMTLDEGIVLTTFFLLAGAIALVVLALQKYPLLGAA